MADASSKRLPFAVTVVSRNPQFRGMEYDMDYNTKTMEAPNIPPPTRRSSLAQTTLIHRYQFSRYLSVLRYFGLRPDYPAFHGFTITPQATPARNSPLVLRPQGVRQANASAAQGTMRRPPRWSKALPTKVVPFNPGVYGRDR